MSADRSLVEKYASDYKKSNRSYQATERKQALQGLLSLAQNSNAEIAHSAVLALGEIVDKQISEERAIGEEVVKLGDLQRQLGNHAEAVRRYHQAHKLGDINVSGRLARAYYQGEGVEKSKEKGDKYMTEYHLNGSKVYFKVANLTIREDRLDYHEYFMRGLSELKEAAAISPEAKIALPVEVFIINPLGILDFLMLAKDKEIGSMVVQDKRSSEALEQWFKNGYGISYIGQLEDVQREQLFHRILSEKHSGNQLAMHFCKQLEVALASSPYYKNMLKSFRDTDKRFEKALKSKPISKMKSGIIFPAVTDRKVDAIMPKRPATYTSAAESPSWKTKLFNLFDRKSTRLKSEVRAKQQAVNDSDPENLEGIQDKHRKRKK